jgi:hypothetical protein
LGDLGVDGRIILKLIFKTWGGSMDWIGVAQESWWALAYVVMNISDSIKWGEFLD